MYDFDKTELALEYHSYITKVISESPSFHYALLVLRSNLSCIDLPCHPYKLHVEKMKPKH